MTRSRYLIAVVLQSFGFSRKVKRMTDAASELHLMQEGEELLGEVTWQNLEEVEDLSMEYWNLRRMQGEIADLLEKQERAEETLRNAQQERTLTLNRVKAGARELFHRREELFEKMENLNSSREKIMEEAAQVKRRFEALKTKANVLKTEQRTSERVYRSTLEEINELRSQFRSFKNRLENIDADIDAHQEELQKLQKQIESSSEDNKSSSSDVYGMISAANKEMSSCRAQLGLIRDEQNQLFRQVGRYLNLHSRQANTRRACSKYRDLLEQVRLLRRSIQWNKKLITRAGG